MIAALLLTAAVPIGTAVVAGVVLWLGGAADRAASAAAGFATADAPPYAPWHEQPGHTLRHALDEPEYLDDPTHDHDPGSM